MIRFDRWVFAFGHFYTRRCRVGRWAGNISVESSFLPIGRLVRRFLCLRAGFLALAQSWTFSKCALRIRNTIMNLGASDANISGAVYLLCMGLFLAKKMSSSPLYPLSPR